MPYIVRRNRPTAHPRSQYKASQNVLAAFVGTPTGGLRTYTLPPQGSSLHLREGPAIYNAAGSASATFMEAYAPGIHRGPVTFLMMGWFRWGGTITFRLGTSNGVALAKSANNGTFLLTPGGYTYNPATIVSYGFSSNPTFRIVVGQFDLTNNSASLWDNAGTTNTRSQTGSYSQPSDNKVSLSIGSSGLDYIQLAAIFSGFISHKELIANPWGWLCPPRSRTTYFFPSGGGGGSTYYKSIAGSLTPTGLIVRKTTKTYTGSITPAGALSRQVVLRLLLQGSISGVGALRKLTRKTASGSVSLSGSLLKKTRRTLGASITAAGTLVRKTTKRFTGSVSASGSLVTRVVIRQTVAGTITAFGSLGTRFIAYVASTASGFVVSLRRFIGRR